MYFAILGYVYVIEMYDFFSFSFSLQAGMSLTLEFSCVVCEKI